VIFPQTFPAFYSLCLVITFSSIIFFWRFFIFRRNLLQAFCSLPSILVFGTKNSGKSSFIRMLTNSQIISHPFKNGLNFARLAMGSQKIQLIEVPHLEKEMVNYLKKLKGMKIVSGFYLFDVSKESDPLESQLENYENIKKLFTNLPLIPIVTKTDMVDKEKLEKIKNRFKEIHMIQLVDELNMAKQDLLKKEVEDLKRLISQLTHEIEVEKKI